MLPDLFLLESLIYFELLLCSRSKHFVVILAIFPLRVAVLSISLSMNLSHADGVPITDPRTLKPSTIVIFAPSKDFTAFSRRFFFL